LTRPSPEPEPVLPAGAKVFLLSLGCAKNQVDSENLSASLQQEGFRFVSDPADAEVIVVNSCGFIREAVEENLAVLDSLAGYRRQGRCRCLVLSGCLVQRYGETLARQLPEIDLFLGMKAESVAGPILGRHLAGLTRQSFFLGPPRGAGVSDGVAPQRVALAPWAYVKISEGCSNRCAYCTLPRIRGPLRSRSRKSVLRETAALARGGAVEINLVAQDVAAYGLDRPRAKADRLSALLRELCRLEEVRWLRLLYCHPAHVSDRLIDLIGETQKICPYLDLPIQHASAALLKRMNRPYTEDRLRALVSKLRRARPDMALRTTVMVGFPGETEKDFARLLRFVEETRFHHLGVFAYSPEEGTAALRSRGKPVSEGEKRRRHREVMRVQAGISRSLQRRYRGTIQEVLVEGVYDPDPRFLKARTRYQAPEVDGVVIIPGEMRTRPGLARARITGSRTYDLTAELCPPGPGDQPRRLPSAHR